MRRAPEYPFEAPFRREVRNLGAPDAEGWAIGDCPYCGTAGGLKANLRTGRWLCLPPAPPPARRLRAVPAGAPGRRQDAGPGGGPLGVNDED